MKQFVVLISFVTLLFVQETLALEFTYSIPESFSSMKATNEKEFEAISKKMLKDGGMLVIDNLSLKDLRSGDLVVNIMMAEEENILSTDKEYTEKLEALFKRHKIENWDIKKWNGFERVGSNKAKLEYFVKTMKGRQLVVLVNYYTEEALSEEIENFILGIALSE